MKTNVQTDPAITRQLNGVNDQMKNQFNEINTMQSNMKNEISRVHQMLEQQ